MRKKTKEINVFIASPGDLAAERKLFRDVVDELNAGFGDGANIKFIALGWEDTIASTGRRNQSVINEDIDKCNVFFLVLNRRWGQTSPDAHPYTSYTEEEFYRAYERLKQEESPEIFVFFKRVDAASEADPGPQLEKVMGFRKQLEESREVLYKYFDSEAEFSALVGEHLRAFAKGKIPRTRRNSNAIILPYDALDAIEKAKKVATEMARVAEIARDSQQETLSKIEAMQLQMAEDAAALSREGKVEFARQNFARLYVESIDPRVLFLSYEFFKRVGELDSARSVLEKLQNLVASNRRSILAAAVFQSLGQIYFTGSELVRAEEMFLEALEIYKEKDNLGGMVRQYCALGHLYRLRGDLKKTEEMYQLGVKLSEELNSKPDMATAYSNLGILHHVRGELAPAEELYKKSLAIELELGNKEHCASDYGNLGNIYLIRGQFDLAEKMYKKSLSIEKALQHKAGMASDFCNLGRLYDAKGDLKKAEAMYKKGLALDLELGRKEGASACYGNLGIIYHQRGDYQRAEEMYRQSLSLSEAMGYKDGVASQYGNLGTVYERRGDFAKAGEMYRKSLAIALETGKQELIADQYGNLGRLSLLKRDYDESKIWHAKALDIELNIGRKAGIATEWNSLGNVCEAQGRYIEANEFYQKALVIYSELQSPKRENIVRKMETISRKMRVETK